MSVLLVDIGNTRIKWSVLRADKLGRQKAMEHVGLSARDLERQLFATRGITRVVAASVATVQETTRGVARGIDIDGALLVETPKAVVRFVSGDVSVRAEA